MEDTSAVLPCDICLEPFPGGLVIRILGFQVQGLNLPWPGSIPGCLGERRGERCKVAPTHSPPPPTTPQPSESQGKENKQFIASGTDGGKAHGTKDQTFRDHTLEERPSSA